MDATHEIAKMGFRRVNTIGPCWICKDPTKWVYLDIGRQHLDCDAYPSPEGDVVIIRGVKHYRKMANGQIRRPK